jgi:predicted transposase YdaD
MAEKQPRKPRNTIKKNVAKPIKKEGNAFDKIFKENIEKIFRPFVEKRLNIKIVKATPLKEKMQTTVELEMDFFYLIETDTGKTFILHLEFESGDNPVMIYRVGEYHGMAQKRYELPIRHVVIYLGEKTPTMRTELKPEEVYTGFDLVNVHALDPNELLNSQIPEVVITAILADYDPTEAEIILRKIIANLKKLVKNKRVLKKYINQLIMLSRLRKIESLTIKITEEMPIHFDYETDTLYLRGIEKGIEKEREKMRKEIEKERQIYVLNLWKSGMESSMISNILNLPIEVIEQIIADFQKNERNK